MAYVDEGKGDPIVFGTAITNVGRICGETNPTLSSVGRCIAPDRFGRARSTNPISGYRFVDQRETSRFPRGTRARRISLSYTIGASAPASMAMPPRIAGEWALAFRKRSSGAVHRLGGVSAFRAARSPDLRERWRGEPMVLDHNMFDRALLPGSSFAAFRRRRRDAATIASRS